MWLEILFLVLYSSIPKKRMVLWWMLTDWSLCNKSSSDETSITTHSYTRRITKLRFNKGFHWHSSVFNCHWHSSVFSCHKFHWHSSVFSFIDTLLCSVVIHLQILTSTLSFLPAPLPARKFQYITIPRSFVFHFPKFYSFRCFPTTIHACVLI